MSKRSVVVAAFALAVVSVAAMSADAPRSASANGASQAEPPKGEQEGRHEGVKQRLTAWEKEIKQRARAITREMNEKLAEVGKEMKSKSTQIRQEAKEKMAALKQEMHEKKATTPKGEKRKED